MKYIKMLIYIFITGLLLPGCGGGGGTTRTISNVTVIIQWPTAARSLSSVSRVIPSTVKSILLEVFSGTTRIYSLPVAIPILGTPDTSSKFSIPEGNYTIYANAFNSSAATSGTYTTNPATGLTNAPAGDVPVANAIESVSIASTAFTLNFTLNNTIASLVPVYPLQSGSTSITTYDAVALDQVTYPLSNRMQALDAQGDTVMVSDSTLSWAVSSNDSFGGARASVDNVNRQLDLISTGMVNLVVSDTEVNSGQPSITGSYSVLITPASAATALTINASNILPYAKSVTATVTQDPLVPTYAPPTGVADNPPAPITSAPVAVTGSTPAFLTAQVKFPSFSSTGRKLLLTVKEWSNADGTGELLGSFSQDGLAPNTTPYPAPFVTNVTGLSITPSAPTIYLNVGGTSLPTSSTLNAALIVKSVTTSVVAAPNTLTWTINSGATAAVSSAGVVTSGSAAETDTVTATDASGNTGTAVITVQAPAGSVNIPIQ